MFDALATLTDLGVYVTVTDTALANALLAAVSSEVREAAGVPITRATSTVTLAGTSEQFLDLPGWPVRTVETVTLDGVAVTDYKIRDARLWRAYGWYDQSVDVVVTYDHGLDEVPADLVRLVCMFTAAGLNAAAGGFGAHRGVAYERGDDYQIGYQQGSDEVVDPTALTDRVKADLSARFGGSAAVTGGY